MCMLSREKFTLENMLVNNVYGRYATFFKNHELKEADKYIKRVFPNAEFYIDYEHALVFERIGEDEEIDMVNHPPHYQHGIEPIEFIESHNLNFCLGSAVKYIARAPYKGTELEDLKKAKWFLEREIKKHDK